MPTGWCACSVDIGLYTYSHTHFIIIIKYCIFHHGTAQTCHLAFPHLAYILHLALRQSLVFHVDIGRPLSELHNLRQRYTALFPLKCDERDQILKYMNFKTFPLLGEMYSMWLWLLFSFPSIHWILEHSCTNLTHIREMTVRHVIIMSNGSRQRWSYENVWRNGKSWVKHRNYKTCCICPSTAAGVPFTQLHHRDFASSLYSV